MGDILKTFTRCTRLLLKNSFWHHRLGAMLRTIGDFQRRKIIIFLKKSIRTMGYILKTFQRCARHFLKQSIKNYVRYCITSWGDVEEFCHFQCVKIRSHGRLCFGITARGDVEKIGDFQRGNTFCVGFNSHFIIFKKKLEIRHSHG